MVLGIDIGGTKIAGARLNGNLEILDRTLLPTLASEPLENSLGQLYGAIEAMLVPEVRAIGICAPGPLNPKTGVIINPSNLPAWRNVPLARLVSERYKLACKVENDANAAGLAEARFGAARGYSSVFYATLSTGIGAGIILNGEIYHGANGAAAEGGHITIDYLSSRICNCGTPGCIEAFASGTALAKEGIDPEELGRGIAGGEKNALRKLDQISLQLAAWLGGIISLLDPGIIVLGGGLSNFGDPLYRRLRELVPRRTINQFASETPIVPAALSRDTGILGAAVTVL
jgi:glucokinase